MSDTSPAKEQAELEQIRAETELTSLKIKQEALKYETAMDKWDLERAMSYDQRILTVYGIDSPSVNNGITLLSQWAAQDRDRADRPEYTLRISSPGGSAIAGFALIDFIQKLQSEGFIINTEGYGYVASMGGVLLQAGNTRRIGRNCYMLIHEVSGGAGGSIGEIEDAKKFYESVNARCRALLESRSNVPKATFTRNWNRKDWWLESDEVIKLGFADEIIESFDYAG